MTISHEGNAASANKTSRLREAEMDIKKALPKPQEQITTPDYSDTEMAASKGNHSPKRKSKQSLDYVLRTGLAGGLAGCAVWPNSLSWRLVTSPGPKISGN